jgi:hypothetical protein
LPSQKSKVKSKNSVSDFSRPGGFSETLLGLSFRHADAATFFKTAKNAKQLTAR